MQQLKWKQRGTDYFGSLQIGEHTITYCAISERSHYGKVSFHAEFNQPYSYCECDTLENAKKFCDIQLNLYRLQICE